MEVHIAARQLVAVVTCWVAVLLSVSGVDGVAAAVHALGVGQGIVVVGRSRVGAPSRVEPVEGAPAAVDGAFVRAWVGVMYRVAVVGVFLLGTPAAAQWGVQTAAAR